MGLRRDGAGGSGGSWEGRARVRVFSRMASVLARERCAAGCREERRFGVGVGSPDGAMRMKVARLVSGVDGWFSEAEQVRPARV